MMLIGKLLPLNANQMRGYKDWLRDFICEFQDEKIA